MRDLRFDRLEADPGVFHVINDELGARVFQDLRDPRREELEQHRAQHKLAAKRAFAQRLQCHFKTPRTPQVI